MKKRLNISCWMIFLAVSTLAQLEGTVIDAESGDPIAGARVKIRTHQEQVITDANGSFSLNDSAAPPFDLVAAKLGYFNQGLQIQTTGPLSDLVISLDPIDLSPVEGHPLNAPEECANCHSEIYDDWVSSPMAKTGLNRWVFDVYNGQGTPGGMGGFVYQRDSVHRDTKPNSECSACHTPIHWLTDIQNAGMGDINNPTVDMQRGVQCEVCHRIMDLVPGKENFPGVHPDGLLFLRGPQNLEFGRLGDSVYENFMMRPAYNPNLGARVCAACHEDNTDHDADDDFEEPGSVPHEATYSEWEDYAALQGEGAKTCVDCHMPAIEDDGFCVFSNDRPPGTTRSHHIRGTSADFLDNAVTTTVTSQTGLSEAWVDVTILNDKTGHAVPSGVVIRNMILLVEAFDNQGARLDLASGELVDPVAGTDGPEQGGYAGLPGKAFFRNMTDGINQRVFYTEATGIAEDSRIQAGQSYQGHFRFILPQGPGPVNFDVRLIYRRTFRDLLLAKNWTTTGLGLELEDHQPPHYGHLMARDQRALSPCGDRDLDQSGAVDLADLTLLLPQWTDPAPFAADEEGLTSIRHLTAVINCL